MLTPYSSRPTANASSSEITTRLTVTIGFFDGDGDGGRRTIAVTGARSFGVRTSQYPSSRRGPNPASSPRLGPQPQRAPSSGQPGRREERRRREQEGAAESGGEE